ncbi:MAG: SigE family RNA polymerase sigma factor [Nocardioides sp.]
MLGSGKRAKDDAFREYVAARRPHLYRTAYLVCGDAHQAEDLVQTALTRAYGRWTTIQRAGDPDGYLRRAMVNARIDEFRKNGRRELVGLADRDMPAPEALAAEDVDLLIATLRTLPIGQRKVVVLRHYLGLSVEETAHDLGLSPGTVKSQTAAALARLRDVYGVSV